MDTRIKTLGPCTIHSPLKCHYPGDRNPYTADDARIFYETDLAVIRRYASLEEVPAFEKAGPRELIHFNPAETTAAIVTCGGLCPGLNDVIWSLVIESWYGYGVRRILGIPFGYNGLLPAKGYTPIELTPDVVKDIHRDGGTMLGSSRGGTENMEALVDSLVALKVNILYAIGGDGTLRGAHGLAEIIERRGLDIAVVGIPKTIDNDISYITKSFGFETAFSEAVDTLAAAHIEAKGAPNGIGLVKVMGRYSGYIAANAALATSDVNYVLIPEEPFDLDGPNGFLHHLEERIRRRGHAVICVAEGAGQDLLEGDPAQQTRDASGNVLLADIGIYLKDKIRNHFKSRGVEANIKYIDPSYIIRSAPANANDSLFCIRLGQNAVHAAMSGRTDLIVGTWHTYFTHVPIELATSKRKFVDTHSQFWNSVLQATGQPAMMKN